MKSTSSDTAEHLIQATYGKSSRVNAKENLNDVDFQQGYADGCSLQENDSRWDRIRVYAEKVGTGSTLLQNYKRGLWSACYQKLT